MSELQLTEAIESTRQSTVPYFLPAALWLPGVKMARTESSIVAMPVGPQAAVQAVSFSLQQFISPDGTIVTAP